MSAASVSVYRVLRLQQERIAALEAKVQQLLEALEKAHEPVTEEECESIPYSNLFKFIEDIHTARHRAALAATEPKP